MEKDLNYSDLRKKEAKIISEWYLFREGLLEIRNNKLQWTESSNQENRELEMVWNEKKS